MRIRVGQTSEKEHLWEEMFTNASGIQAKMKQVLDFSKRSPTNKIEFQEDPRARSRASALRTSQDSPTRAQFRERIHDQTV